jgi:hypothetical protein
MRSLGGIAAARLSAGGGADQASLAADAHARQPRLLGASAAPPRAWEERRALDGGVPAQNRRGAPASGIAQSALLATCEECHGGRHGRHPCAAGTATRGAQLCSCAVAACLWRVRTPDTRRLRSRARCPTARRRCRRRRSASGAAHCSMRCTFGCASACALTRFARRVAFQRGGGGARLHARLGAETRSARATCVPATPRAAAAALRVDYHSCAFGAALAARLRASKCWRRAVSAAARACVLHRSKRAALP